MAFATKVASNPGQLLYSLSSCAHLCRRQLDRRLNKPITAYQGNEPYVFVCYAHKDSENVYSDLNELDGHGIKLWYDEGIAGGTSWRAEIAAAIEGAEKFIFYISDASLRSSHCLREVDYALDHEIDIVPVYLEKCPLPAELGLPLNRVQALFKRTDANYSRHLLQALKRKPGLTARLPISKKRKFRLGLPLSAAGVALLIFLAWVLFDASQVSESVVSKLISAPNAYDPYLEGLGLMERWDKGDNLETAIGLFREAANVDPNFALAYARLADALRLRFALTGEQEWLDQATENANEAVNLNPNLAPVQVALGRIHLTVGNLDLASAAVETALSIDPNDATAIQTSAKLYERQGRLEDAESSFRKAITLDPEDIVIRDSYANFLFRQSRFEEAADEWRILIRLAPDHFGALVNLGSALSELGRIPESITMYERAIEIKPSYMAYSNLGTAYFRAQRYPKAVEAIKKAIEIDDSDWLAWGNLAFTYSWMDGLEQQAAETFEHAIELAEAARSRHPRDPYVHADLALYYAKTARPELAVQRLETAITLSPDTGEVLAAAAEALELIGQRERAIELARKSLQLDYSIQRLQRNPELADLLQDSRMQDLP